MKYLIKAFFIITMFFSGGLWADEDVLANKQLGILNAFIKSNNLAPNSPYFCYKSGNVIVPFNTVNANVKISDLFSSPVILFYYNNGAVLEYSMKFSFLISSSKIHFSMFMLADSKIDNLTSFITVKVSEQDISKYFTAFNPTNPSTKELDARHDYLNSSRDIIVSPTNPKIPVILKYSSKRDISCENSSNSDLVLDSVFIPLFLTKNK